MPHIMKLGVVFSDYSHVVYYNIKKEKLQNPPPFTIQYFPFPLDLRLDYNYLSCATIDVPFKRYWLVQKMYIYLNPDVFDNGIRPKYAGFIVAIHYRNQLFLGRYFSQNQWPGRGKNSSKAYLMNFHVSGVEIMQYRKNGKQACDANISNFDAIFKHRIMDSVGCKPPYWNSISALPQCWKMEQMKEMLLKANNVNDERIKEDIGRPCRVLSNVQFEMIEHDKDDASMPNVDINFSFRMSAY